MYGFLDHLTHCSSVATLGLPTVEAHWVQTVPAAKDTEKTPARRLQKSCWFSSSYPKTSHKLLWKPNSVIFPAKKGPKSWAPVRGPTFSLKFQPVAHQFTSQKRFPSFVKVPLGIIKQLLKWLLLFRHLFPTNPGIHKGVVQFPPLLYGRPFSTEVIFQLPGFQNIHLFPTLGGSRSKIIMS